MSETNAGDIIVSLNRQTREFSYERVVDPQAGPFGRKLLGIGATSLEVACAGAVCGVSGSQRVWIADERNRLREYAVHISI